MTFVVTEACIKCKYMDCIQMCPVDCFHEGREMLVINPEFCVDCAVCEPECPVNAIISDDQPGAEKWVEMNTKYAVQWPNITVRDRHTPPDADRWADEKDKFDRFFTGTPGRE